jgi:hypothetical protein
MNMSKTIEAGYEVVRGYNANTNQLIDAHAITKAQAQERVNRARSASAGLDEARTALADCRARAIPDNKCWPAIAKTTAARALLEVEQ